MTTCTCTCLMCHLYGHRPDLKHCPNCPERKKGQARGKFPMHEGGKK